MKNAIRSTPPGPGLSTLVAVPSSQIISQSICNHYSKSKKWVGLRPWKKIGSKILGTKNSVQKIGSGFFFVIQPGLFSFKLQAKKIWCSKFRRAYYFDKESEAVFCNVCNTNNVRVQKQKVINGHIFLQKIKVGAKLKFS